MELLDAVRFENDLKLDAIMDNDFRLVMQILTSEAGAADERRRFSRATYVARATVELTDPMGHAHRIQLWSRDANQWGVGIVTRCTLPVGQSATLQIKGSDGVDIRARGCILRCREVLPGWYEGAVLFEHEQPSLAPATLDRAA